MNKRILITGASGFIGANLVRYFYKDSDVFALVRKNSNLWRIKNILPEIELRKVNLLEEKKLNSVIAAIRPDVVIHSAVYGSYPFQRDEKKILQVNLSGTVNLLNACKKTGFEVFINTGSSSEYGIKNEPMKETDLIEPMDGYGVSKAAVTLFCQSKAKKEKLPVLTLRLFSHYGNYEEGTRLIPSVVLSCLKGKNPEVSSAASVRDFIYIKDVMEAYKKAIESEECHGEVINISYGRQHTVGDVVQKIVELTGNKAEPLWNSVDNSRIEPDLWQADITKAKKILNWEPVYSLETGLRLAVEWYKENYELYGI